MIATKGIKLKSLLGWTFHHVVWLLILMGGITYLYHVGILKIEIPWLPVSVVGTAVAFYVGFKNNQAYDRMWEARKIWGGIVNDSRTWGMYVDGFVTSFFQSDKLAEQGLKEIKKRLVYRHIAWLYVHRSQLLIPTEWEHISQSGSTGKLAKRYQKTFGLGLVKDELGQTKLNDYLAQAECNRFENSKNRATQIINEQSRDLTHLRESNVLNDFRHIEMEKVLRSFYTLQGKNERIKKFPLPRQYANMSRYFIGIFISLLPFSMIPELISSGTYGLYLAAPITALIGLVYVLMEVIGDYSENPFQGMANDIPMLSLCRTIEIDLKEMLGETDLPPNIKTKNGVLM
ncbi:MAG: bestrophin family protein [Salibacteraceae bacterium]